MELKHCRGCRDDFYNGKNDLGVTKCWMFDKKKKLETRYEISIHTPMSQKSGYRKMKLPPCYHAQGQCYLKEIPSYAK